jgi:hypothetical protein
MLSLLAAFSIVIAFRPAFALMQTIPFYLEASAYPDFPEQDVFAG